MTWKPTHVQRTALRAIEKAGGIVTVSRRGDDRTASVSRGAGAPQRIPLPSVDVFLRRGLLELLRADRLGETVFEKYELSETGWLLAKAASK